MVDIAEHRTGGLAHPRAIVAVSAMVAIGFMLSTVVTPLYLGYQQAFHFSSLTLTLIYAVYAVGNLAALLVFGRLSDVLGRRTVALPGMAVSAIAALVFLLAAGTTWLFCARALAGLGVGIASGTGTAWLAELDADKARATRIATGTNFVGLAVGALLAGLLATYAPQPLKLVFVVYLVMLAAVTIGVAAARETVAPQHGGFDARLLLPRVGIPAEIRAQFVAPAATAFNAMGLVGFYAALIPGTLARDMHLQSPLVAGLVVAELTAAVALAILVTQRLSSRTAMLWALGLMFPSLALLVLAKVMASMPLLIGTTLLGALATALGYRGSLQVINRIAPKDRRAEVVSAYMIVAFIGNAVPVVGVGLIALFAGYHLASIVFAAVLALLAAAGLVTGLRYAPRDD